MTERELIEEAQRLKARLKGQLKQVYQINVDAGRPAVANAVFKTIAELDVWHGSATERLLEHFPDFGSDVVIQGGGGR